jgi:formate hydrogenlyase subunit 5
VTVIPGAASPTVEAFSERVLDRVDAGMRFCGLFASAAAGGTRLLAVLVDGGELLTESVVVPDGAAHYPSLAPRLAAAAWYEREVHDLFGLVPIGNNRLDPLVLPLLAGSPRPRPGAGGVRQQVEVDVRPLPAHLRGEGVFTIPYGPVRSGVFESIEYLVETAGEDIPHLRTRVFRKHRGVEVQFEGKDLRDGVLIAERCEGAASVAHAIAYCGAVEQLAGVQVPEAAGLVRVVHAELERVANHLDSAIRHTEAAGQAVAYARLTLHKERVQRLRGRICGSRFGRGVVVPGGVSGALRLAAAELLAGVDQIERAVTKDLHLLMATPSFVDRLRRTGVVLPELARQYVALGPVGRGSGQTDDARIDRPYGAYPLLGHEPIEPRVDGDALARQRVRVDEIAGAFTLVGQAVARLDQSAATGAEATWAVPIDGAPSGEAIGWAEAPQGEVLYLLAMEEGRLVRVKPRSASFHNMAMFHAAFPKDILTDFAFIEASFGLSIAGVAG